MKNSVSVPTQSRSTLHLQRELENLQQSSSKGEGRTVAAGLTRFTTRFPFASNLADMTTTRTVTVVSSGTTLWQENPANCSSK